MTRPSCAPLPMKLIFLPSTSITSALVETYWTDLATVPEQFKARFNEHEKPTIKDALCVSMNPATISWFAFDVIESPPRSPLGEFTIQPLNGASALVHFSANPVYHLNLAEKFDISIQFHKLFFSRFSHTLIGVTPIDNKPAVATTTRFGYKVVGIIPDIVYTEGKRTPGMLSYMSKEHFTELYLTEE